MAPNTANKVLWISVPEYKGALLIRGGRLDGAGRVLIATSDVKTSTGVGSASQISVGSAPLAFYEGIYIAPSSTTDFRDWPSYTYVSASGCYAWQVDGDAFTEVITFKAS